MISSICKSLMVIVLVVSLCGAGVVVYGDPSGIPFTSAANAGEKPPTSSLGFDPGDKPEGCGSQLWALVKETLPAYPLALASPSEDVLVVRMADQSSGLFVSADWEVCETESVVLRNAEKILPPIAKTCSTIRHKKDGYVVQLRIGQCGGSHDAMRAAICASTWMLSAARGSTWHGVAPIPVQDASFVANLAKGPSNTVVWSVGNIMVLLAITKDAADSLARLPPTTTWWGQPTHFLDEAELGRLASQLSIVVAGSAPEAKPAEPNQLKVTIGEMIENSVSISVETPEDGGLKGWWIRMDTTAGQLTLEAPGRAVLTGVPEGGATVKCYAVSSDGKKWYSSSVRVEGQEGESKPPIEAPSGEGTGMPTGEPPREPPAEKPSTTSKLSWRGFTMIL